MWKKFNMTKTDLVYTESYMNICYLLKKKSYKFVLNSIESKLVNSIRGIPSYISKVKLAINKNVV